MSQLKTIGMAVGWVILACGATACLQSAPTTHVAGAAGTACNTTYHKQGCYVTTGKPALQERMQCVGGKWVVVEICASSLLCVERDDPSAPNTAMRYASCKAAADTSSVGADTVSVPDVYTPKDLYTSHEVSAPKDTYLGIVCGDGICAVGETPQSCAADCQIDTCGNGHCEANESAATCMADCVPQDGVCGDGLCEASESAAACAGDCTSGGYCARKFCNNELQACLSASECTAGFDCLAGCGMDGTCATSCVQSWGMNQPAYSAYVACLSYAGCQATGMCGDGTCSPGETRKNCPSDCSGNGWRRGCIVEITKTAGCQGCACESCVCSSDPYCCNLAWDNKCTVACSACGDCP